jgi:hypothetical protein
MVNSSMSYSVRLVIVLLILSAIAACNAQSIDTDHEKWDRHKTKISDGRIFSFSNPVGAKYIMRPVGKCVLNGDSIDITMLGYDPGESSGDISELWIQMAFYRYADSSNSSSMKGLKREVSDLISVNKYELGPDYVKQENIENIGNQEWYHVVWARDVHQERVSSDKYYLPYSPTYYLVIGGVYKKRLRKNPRWLEIGRELVKEVISEVRIEE